MSEPIKLTLATRILITETRLSNLRDGHGDYDAANRALAIKNTQTTLDHLWSEARKIARAV